MGFLERHKVIRRTLMVWIMGLITYTTLAVFDGGEVSGGKAAAYATCVGMLSVILGIYFHKRHGEDGDVH